MLLKGATLISDPCPYCKGVRVMKDGHALCVNCGREAKEEIIPVPEEKTEDSTLTKFEQKLKTLSEELEHEKDHLKQQQIMKSISDLMRIIAKIKKQQRKKYLCKNLAPKDIMSSKKSAPLPASSAGLLRFFEDETKGYRVRPEIVVSIPTGLIVLSWILKLFFLP